MSAMDRLVDVHVRRQALVIYSPVFMLVTLALIVRLHGISVPVIWYDEAYSLLLSERSPALIWSTTAGDVHPPLYYLILHYWTMVFGNGVFSARSLSTLADIGTLVLCIKLMSLIATRRAALIAGVLLVLLPISVRYSQEARMYALLGFWLMAATVALVCWSRQPHLKRYPVMYVLLMTAAFYTHYFAALCVLVHWLYWSGVGSDEPVLFSVRKWLLVNVTIVVLYLPWLPNFIHQTSGMKGLEWIPPTTWDMLPGLVSQYTVMISASEGGLWVSLIISALMIICAVMALRLWRSDRRVILLLIGYFFVPVITLFLLSWVAPLFYPRYLVFTAVSLPLIVAVMLDRLAERSSVVAVVCLSVFIAAEVHGVLKVYPKPKELSAGYSQTSGRLDIVANGLKHYVESGDEIVVDGLFWYLPFTYYNTTGIQPRLYISRSPAGELEGPGDFGGWLLIPSRKDWIFFNDLSALSPASKRVWWITLKPRPENVMKFPSEWTQKLTLKGGAVEARLFILGGER